MPEVSRTHMGGTMRLGARTTFLREGSLGAHIYGATTISERHRHRYEINIDYVKKLEEKGMEFVGRDTTGERMEVFELAGHPYYVGCQFRPELTRTPRRLRWVRTGYAYQPPALGTYRRRRAALPQGPRTVRTGYAYQPRALGTYRVLWHPRFHPEFKSRPQSPSPLFVGLILTAAGLPLP